MHGRASTALSAAGPLRSFMFPARPWSALDIVAQVCTAKSGQATYLVYLLVGRMALAKSWENSSEKHIMKGSGMVMSSPLFDALLWVCFV